MFISFDDDEKRQFIVLRVIFMLLLPFFYHHENVMGHAWWPYLWWAIRKWKRPASHLNSPLLSPHSYSLPSFLLLRFQQCYHRHNHPPRWHTRGGQVLLRATALYRTSQPAHPDRASETLAPHLVELVQPLNLVIVNIADRERNWIHRKLLRFQPWIPHSQMLSLL